MRALLPSDNESPAVWGGGALADNESPAVCGGGADNESPAVCVGEHWQTMRALLWGGGGGRQ